MHALYLNELEGHLRRDIDAFLEAFECPCAIPYCEWNRGKFAVGFVSKKKKKKKKREAN